MIRIRHEEPGDIPLIASLFKEACGRESEAVLADRLRRASAEHLPFAADDYCAIVGHLLFTPVLIQGARPIHGRGPGARPLRSGLLFCHGGRLS